MQTKKRKLLINILIAAILVVTGVNASYAWYVYYAQENAPGNMGAVKLSINSITPVNENGAASFNIKNDSTIDTYIRLGWTPVYIDSKTSEYLTTDVSGIEIINASFNTNSGLNGMKLSFGEITSLNGYVKKMITMTDEIGNYFVIPAGCAVTGQIELNTGGDGLHIIFMPEALQATKKAAANAADYGWDESCAVNQARGIYNDGGAQ